MSMLRATALGSAILAAGCGGFSPTAPFEGFDGKGTRLRGSFDAGAAAQGGEVRAAAASPQGIRVSLRERASVAAVVGGDGRFTLEGLPAGAWSLVFVRDGQEVGEIRFRSVRRNQEITIVVGLTTDDEVVLVQESRDAVSFEGECPRGAGFWCQNQGGGNPNLSAEEFPRFATDAAALFAGKVAALDDPAEVAAAVCNTGDQLLRHLATLGLNLAAKTLDRATPLVGEPYANVGAAFDAAVAAAGGGASRDEANQVKDVLERINENQSTNVCDALPDDDDGDAPPPTTGKMKICHVPPGNPGNAHTLTIDASAWPAHQRHGDTQGACPGGR